ncbi:hypothetical protein [Hymenobacter coalescens]
MDSVPLLAPASPLTGADTAALGPEALHQAVQPLQLRLRPQLRRHARARRRSSTTWAW